MNWRLESRAQYMFNIKKKYLHTNVPSLLLTVEKIKLYNELSDIFSGVGNISYQHIKHVTHHYNNVSITDTKAKRFICFITTSHLCLPLLCTQMQLRASINSHKSINKKCTF